MPDVTIRIDTSAFQAMLKEYRKISERGLAEDINRKAFHIMKAAVALTKKADAKQIASEIGPTQKEVVGYKLRSVKRRVTKAEHEAKNGKA